MTFVDFVRLAVRRGEIVFDVGANGGQTSVVLAGVVGRRGTVCAFEPNPKCVHHLTRAISASRYNNIRVLPVALSDVSGEMTLFVDEREAAVASTLSPRHAAREIERHHATYAEAVVQTMRLDDYCGESGLSPDFVKIDVEGAEDRVIRGGSKTLESSKPLLWFECWAGVENGRRINEGLGHFERLRAQGYEFFLATVFNFANTWVDASDGLNPRYLLPLDPADLVKMPVIGCDIVAAAEKHMNCLRARGLISTLPAKRHFSQLY